MDEAQRGYHSIIKEFGELMGVESGTVFVVLTDLVASGIIPRSSGRAIAPVTRDGAFKLAFAVAARSAGMSKASCRATAISWQRSRMWHAPSGACIEVRTSFGSCIINLDPAVVADLNGLLLSIGAD